ncbi:copper homeostasis CutC domain-containing protein [Massariosphaeria phaeospora]|uniref:Copper homeostasis protein cutC homolog n=1 Tax=Massariosphaeria phaeospora TaxID=100035 RepID=A0A7C8IHJ8_9PLEO|nr:copper homeostasis CutC domain-containing protein [Massariosphaeria phaeospora]
MLEIACFNAPSAVAAANAGADRIELCADYAAGGLTPSLAALQQLRTAAAWVAVHVMIRPRPGDFAYSAAEFAQMKAAIRLFQPHADGFVFGVLDGGRCVDAARNQELVALAAPRPCTFHRAFDQTPSLSEAARQLVGCGFASILTSGGQADAVAGADCVAQLQRSTWGTKVSFILGGGVRSSNAARLKSQAKVQWYHSAAITRPGEHVDEEEVARLRHVLSQPG